MGRKNRKRPTTYNQNVAQEQLNNSVYVNEELNSPKCMSSAETVPKFFDSNRSIPIKSSLSDVFKRFVDHFTVRRPADTCPNCNASLRLPGSPFQLFPSPRPSISEQGVNSSNISDTDKNVHDDKADPKTTLQFMVKFMQRAPEDKKRIVDTLEFLSTSDSSHLDEFLEYVKLKEGQSTEIPKPGSPAPADPKPSYDSIEETCRDDVEVFVEASTLAKSNNGNKSIIPNRVILAAAKERREHASNLSLPTVPTKNIPMGKNDFVMSCANNRKLVRSSTVAVRLGNLSTPMRPLEARLQKRASLTGSSNANLDIADRNVAKRPNILMGRSQSTSGNHANYNQATSLTAADKEPTAALSLSLTECSSLNYNMAADQAALNFQELRTPDCSLSPQGTLISNNPQPCDSFALPPIAAFPPAPPPSSNNLNVPLAPPPPPPGLCGKTPPPPAPPPPPNGLFSVPLAPPPPPPGICGIKASPPLAPSPPPADLFRGIPPAPPPPPSICTGPAAPPPPPPGLCGGGPSPSTPLMLDGFLLPQVVKSEEIYHKTKKLQAVRWTRLAHAETQKKENIWSKPTQLEFTSDERDEIEATFEQPVFTPRVSLAPKRIKSDESVVEKSAEVCLDQQRNLQLEICLKKLRDLSVDDMVQKLESGDLEGVPISELDTLANVYPSNDELIKFSSLTREQVSSKPSILCFYAAKNPNLKLIIELIVLQNSVFTELQNYDEQVVSIEDAMKAARSDVIVDVLHKSLKYGNFINQGTSMAGAAGFKLASLPETLSIRGKGSYSNLCFADLLVNNMEFKKADIEKLIQRLDVLRKLKLSDVRDTILGSLRTSESLGKRLNRCEHEELISRYSNFLEEVLSKFRSLNLKIDELRAMEDSLNTYFCGDKETAEDICLVLSKSLSLLVEALNKKSTPKPRAMSLVTINSPCLSPIMNRESLTRRSFNPQKRVSSEEFQKIVADAQSQK